MTTPSSPQLPDPSHPRLDPNASSGSMTEVGPGVYAPASALRFGYARSSGPGGQNVNKLNTKVELWLKIDALRGLNPGAIGRLRHEAGKRITNLGELHLSSDSERGQEGNRAQVLQRLRDLIVKAKVEPKIRRKRKVSRAAKQRRLEHKRHRSDVKAKRRSAGAE